jgi:mono/diheme cytochrome c family protein
VGAPTPQECTPASSCSATTPTVTFPIVPAFHLKGDATKGKGIFTQNCGGCHTLADAGTSGTVGPNLDSLKPGYQATTAQVTNGGALMPAFKGQLSTQQIADVATYVVTATGGTP